MNSTSTNATTTIDTPISGQFVINITADPRLLDADNRTELELLAMVIKTTYNSLADCDQVGVQRRVTNVTIDTDYMNNLIQGISSPTTSQQQSPNQRHRLEWAKEWTQQDRQRHRQLQDEDDNHGNTYEATVTTTNNIDNNNNTTGSFFRNTGSKNNNTDPTMNTGIPLNQNYQLLVVVTGICRGCGSELGLFDDVSDNVLRRVLQHSQLTDYHPSVPQQLEAPRHLRGSRKGNPMYRDDNSYDMLPIHSIPFQQPEDNRRQIQEGDRLEDTDPDDREDLPPCVCKGPAIDTFKDTLIEEVERDDDDDKGRFTYIKSVNGIQERYTINGNCQEEVQSQSFTTEVYYTLTNTVSNVTTDELMTLCVDLTTVAKEIYNSNNLNNDMTCDPNQRMVQEVSMSFVKVDGTDVDDSTLVEDETVDDEEEVACSDLPTRTVFLTFPLQVIRFQLIGSCYDCDEQVFGIVDNNDGDDDENNTNRNGRSLRTHNPRDNRHRSLDRFRDHQSFLPCQTICPRQAIMDVSNQRGITREEYQLQINLQVDVGIALWWNNLQLQHEESQPQTSFRTPLANKSASVTPLPITPVPTSIPTHTPTSVPVPTRIPTDSPTLSPTNDGGGSTFHDRDAFFQVPTCGNGIVEINNLEQCDEGELNSDSSRCRQDCQWNVCGDGFVLLGDEECDDANTNSNDDCKNDCTFAICGDGILGPDEECDDGNTNNNDDCKNDCTFHVCGDGIVGPTEDCDDGNTNNDDGCRNDCSIGAIPTTGPVTPTPITAVPVTPSPVTMSPSAEFLNLGATSTQAPLAPIPTSQAPATQFPVTTAPEIQSPSTNSPITSSTIAPDPVTLAPVTTSQAPATQFPVTLAPETQSPLPSSPTSSSTNTPGPVTLPPVRPPPITRPPVTMAPVTKSLVTSAPLPTSVAPAPATHAPVLDNPWAGNPVSTYPVTFEPILETPTSEPTRVPTGELTPTPTPEPTEEPAAPTEEPNVSPLDRPSPAATLAPNTLAPITPGPVPLTPPPPISKPSSTPAPIFIRPSGTGPLTQRPVFRPPIASFPVTTATITPSPLSSVATHPPCADDYSLGESGSNCLKLKEDIRISLPYLDQDEHSRPVLSKQVNGDKFCLGDENALISDGECPEAACYATWVDQSGWRCVENRNDIRCIDYITCRRPANG